MLSLSKQFCLCLFLVEPWFETKEDLLEASIIGKDIRLPCSARGGFPLRKVEWKFQKANDEKVTVCLGKRLIQRQGLLCSNKQFKLLVYGKLN